MTKPRHPGKDKRRHPRRAVPVGGSVILADGRRVTCEISDISETGARLVLAAPVALPIEFTLEIGGNAARRRCNRSRQNGRVAGVRFPDRPGPKV